MKRKKSKKKEPEIEKPIEVKLPDGPYEKDGRLIEPERKKDYELSPIETEKMFEDNVRSDAYK